MAVACPAEHVLTAVVRAMHTIAPLGLADASWDNVGLLVDATGAKGSNVTKPSVLITIDFSDSVLAEAISKNCSVVISYHPPIFSPMRRLTRSDWKQRLILDAIANGISIYSPHSALDATKGGINDWLCSLFGAAKGDSFPIVPASVDCKSTSSSEAQTGYGRIATLAEPITVQRAVEMLKEGLGLHFLRVATPAGISPASVIRSVAVAAGSGASVLRAMLASQKSESIVDLFLTGEMGHHDTLAAVEKGIVVILAEHTNTERGYLAKILRPRLSELLHNENVGVVVASTDAEPMSTW